MTLTNVDGATARHSRAPAIEVSGIHSRKIRLLDTEAKVTTAPEVAGARIQRVEEGLRPAVAIAGQPQQKWKIAERLKFYKVPGVSVAVIADGKVEWARGYGVVAENGRPVDAALPGCFHQQARGFHGGSPPGRRRQALAR